MSGPSLEVLKRRIIITHIRVHFWAPVFLETTILSFVIPAIRECRLEPSKNGVCSYLGAQ